MAALSSYTPIATYTIPTTVGSYTFNSIPATYTDLVIVTNAIGASDADFSIRFNSDTSSLYSMTGLEGTGTTAVSFRRSSATLIQLQNDTIISGNFNFNSTINQRSGLY
jgi:hypothetical protein